MNTIKCKELLEEYNKIKVNSPVSFSNSENYNDLDCKQLLKLMLQDKLIVETKNGELIKKEDNKVYIGKLFKKTGFGFVDVGLGEDLFTKNVNHYLNLDFVVVKEIPDDKKSGAAFILGLAERSNSLLIARVSPKQKIIPLEASQYEDKTIDLIDMDINQLKPKTVIALEIVSITTKTIKCKLHNIISDQSDPDLDMKIILTKYNIEPEFPQSVIDEANIITDKADNSNATGRVDLRNTVHFTIDGDDSKDLDDAIAMKKDGDKYRLYVSIADVSHYIQTNTEIDKEAFKRGTSVYFIDRVVPMLPKNISNGICSLQADVDRLTMTCEMVINNKLEVEDIKVYNSIINSKYRLTYKNVNKLLEGDEKLSKEYSEIKETLLDMNKIAKKIRDIRFKRGSFNLEDGAAKFKLDENGDILEIVPEVRGDSEKLIEEFMILANESVTRFAIKKEVDFVYRTHGNPNPTKLEDLQNLLYVLQQNVVLDVDNVKPQQFKEILDNIDNDIFKRVVSKLIVRSLPKAVYGTNNEGHFGLASNNYTHFTSPIRRYPDLLVHRILKAVVTDDQNFLDNLNTKDLQQALQHCNEKEVNAIKAEQDIEDMKKTEYMKQFISQTFVGTVSSIEDYGMFVELENTIRGLIRFTDLKGIAKQTQFGIEFNDGREIKLGDEIKVMVASVNVERSFIDFLPVDFDHITPAEKKEIKQKEKFEKYGKKNDGKRDFKKNFRNDRNNRNSDSRNDGNRKAKGNFKRPKRSNDNQNKQINNEQTNQVRPKRKDNSNKFKRK